MCSSKDISWSWFSSQPDSVWQDGDQMWDWYGTIMMVGGYWFTETGNLSYYIATKVKIDPWVHWMSPVITKVILTTSNVSMVIKYDHPYARFESWINICTFYFPNDAYLHRKCPCLVLILKISIQVLVAEGDQDYGVVKSHCKLCCISNLLPGTVVCRQRLMSHECQKGPRTCRNFLGDISKCIFFKRNIRLILIHISLKVVPVVQFAKCHNWFK